MPPVLASLSAHLQQQLSELARLGEGHALIWIDRAYPERWMQVSVHGGIQHYLTVQFVRPDHLSQRQINALFQRRGWKNIQADGRDCLAYYLERSATGEQLRARTEQAANACARAMQVLWGVEQSEQILLRRAFGPLLAFPAVAEASEPHRLPTPAASGGDIIEEAGGQGTLTFEEERPWP